VAGGDPADDPAFALNPESLTGPQAARLLVRGAFRGQRAAVRGRLDGPDGTVWDIGRIMVAPDLQGEGLGRALLAHIQAVAPDQVTSYVLFTGAGSERNLRMYKKAGFRLRADVPPAPGAVILIKPRRANA
jgi:GNAT superfamily N-acetyltransferase